MFSRVVLLSPQQAMMSCPQQGCTETLGNNVGQAYNHLQRHFLRSVGICRRSGGHAICNDGTYLCVWKLAAQHVAAKAKADVEAPHTHITYVCINVRIHVVHTHTQSELYRSSWPRPTMPSRHHTPCLSIIYFPTHTHTSSRNRSVNVV